ncbi:MAG: hypothetical protein V4733_05665 [Verrucomicrobiota bacterium]
MARKRARKNADLDDLDQAQLALFEREKEIEQTRARIVAERIERDSMIPPMEEIKLREKMREHEYLVSRGEVTNVLRAQNRSLLLLVLLVTASCTMIWWGITILRGN